MAGVQVGPYLSALGYDRWLHTWRSIGSMASQPRSYAVQLSSALLKRAIVFKAAARKHVGCRHPAVLPLTPSATWVLGTWLS